MRMLQCGKPQWQRNRNRVPGWRVLSAILPISLPVAAGEQDPDTSQFAAWLTTSSAQPLEGPLVTDRPDFTESTETIPTGHAQIELGYTFTVDRERETRVRTHTAPELLLRLGVASDFELRLGWEGYGWFETRQPAETRAGRPIRTETWDQGASDVSIGVKYKFAEQAGSWPHMGVIVALTAPSGSANVTDGDVEPEVVFLWAYGVNDRFSVAGNAGVAVSSQEGDSFTQGKASLSFGYVLTDRVGVYAEYFGFYPNAEHSDAAHSVNGGVTYLVNDNFQLDARVGAGLNEEADDFFAGVGFSYRW